MAHANRLPSGGRENQRLERLVVRGRPEIPRYYNIKKRVGAEAADSGGGVQAEVRGGERDPDVVIREKTKSVKRERG